MGSNTAPTEEEIDLFMELYEEEGTIKGVAEREEVDWSRPTVSKWIKRRQEEEEQEQEEEEQATEENPEPDMNTEPTPTQPEGDYTVDEEPVPENLVSEPDAPNDILLDIIERDPKLGEDEKKYVKRFFSDYGQLSPSDVTDILSDLSINNKRMTIGRINRHYEKAVNRRLREDPDLQYDERWATLLTKVTGDNHYIRQAQQHDPYGGDIGGISPPNQSGNGAGPAAGGGGINPPTPNGGGQNQQRTGGVQAPPRQAQAQPPMGGQPGVNPQQQQSQGGEQGLDPFQERLLEMLEEKIDDGNQTPQPTPEPKDATSQIQELLELQKQMEELQAATGGGSGGMDEEVQSLFQQVEQRMKLLEQQINDSGEDERQQVQQTRSGGGDGDSMLGEIAMLAETVDDPDLLSTLIETQMDPEVLEARAKNREIENETEWKKALAESLSPAAAEKAIDAFLNVSSSLSNPAQQQNQQQRAQPAPAQQPQGQPAQQAQAQPAQPARQEPNEQATPGTDVEVVDDGNSRNRPDGQTPTPATATADSSPLREQGEEALEGDGTEPDVEETADAETDTTEEDEE